MPTGEQLTALVNEALEILEAFGTPLGDLSKRRKAKMAKAFAAVCGIRPGQTWANTKSNDPTHRLRSRDIIEWMNAHLGENISSGSYDDIRRKDLLLPVEAGIVLRAAGNEAAATNDGTRGYAINPEFAVQIRKYGTADWKATIEGFMAGKETLVRALDQRRKLAMIPVSIGGKEIVFSPGVHNQIQKAVVEEFLPRFGHGASVLYVGDTEDKFLYLDHAALKKIGFFEIGHEKLPDVLAYSQAKNWLFVIEVVHSANPIDVLRKRTLEQLTQECAADIVYVTAFLDRDSFKKFSADIAWETEVWIAEDPTHMIHFNGDKFLGPHR
jgi:type II restriction enzyme